MDRVTLGVGPDVGPERLAFGDIDLDGKQVADEMGDAHIVPETDLGRRIELDHFADVGKMVESGSGARREIADVRLSRYACHLIFRPVVTGLAGVVWPGEADAVEAHRRAVG